MLTRQVAMEMMSRKERVDDAFEYLWKCVNKLPSKLAHRCIKVIENPAFMKSYGSSVGLSTHEEHHAYPGGLVVHTAEVLENALRMAQSQGIQHANQNVITTAVIFHDYAKIYDYDDKGHKTAYREFIRHVSGSYAEFILLAGDLDEELKLKIGHCILSHHGRHHWGSPVEPKTIEASIVHYADMLSCQYGAGK